MQSLNVFLQIGGAVALLLFALHQVRNGMTEAFGLRLKMVLGLGTRTPLRAALSGFIATLGLQSSTATALMTASFVERDLIRARMAQIVLLGANAGTALTAVLVSLGLEALSPLFLLTGYLLRRRHTPAWSGTGLALIGIGLLLVSLELLGHATDPLRDAPRVIAFLSMLDGAWPVAFICAVLLALLCSSSLAAVMLVMALPLSPALTVVMVLGANLGGSIPPLLATLKSAPVARRVTAGNLAVRAIGCLVVLPLAPAAELILPVLPASGAGLAVSVHLVFNLLLGLLIWPFTGMVARFIEKLIPDEGKTADTIQTCLKEEDLETPALALAGASREALALGDMIERMLTQTRTAFRKSDPAPLAEVSILEDRVDRHQQGVKTYLSRLGNRATEEEKRRAITVLDYVINLEHIGDIIEKGLTGEVRKKVGLSLRFSDEGYKELDTLFLMTLENLRMAQTIFMTRDQDMARRLMEVKVDIRNLERSSAQKHLIRLREGQTESIETSSLHLDILRDLKRINAHLVSVAHPILDEQGLLVESRLRAG